MPANDSPGPTPSPRATGRAVVANPPGAVDMSGYPLLVYGPREDAQGNPITPVVRVASASIPVAEILAARDADPGGDLARRFRISPEEVAEVLRWADDPEKPGA